MSAALIKHLQGYGLKVVNHNRKGRPGSFTPRGIIAHHDASGARSGNDGALGIIRSGRPDIPGPLSQFQISRDGTVHLITTGRANHAGTGSASWIPRNSGNRYAWGIEAANNGTGEPWPPKQMEAYERLCAALLAWMGLTNVDRIIAHKEYAGGRKIDPSFAMGAFRSRVRTRLNGTSKPTSPLPKNAGGNVVSLATITETRKRRSGHHQVKLIQRALKKIQQNAGTPAHYWLADNGTWDRYTEATAHAFKRDVLGIKDNNGGFGPWGLAELGKRSGAFTAVQ